MNEIELKKFNIIKVRSEFIDLLGYLENININFVNINELLNYIYTDPLNEYRYKISEIENNNEIYIFKYLKENTNESIPNAIFYPHVLYDFDIDLTNKIFKKLDEYKIVDHIIIDLNIPNRKNKKSLIRKIFGC